MFTVLLVNRVAWKRICQFWPDVYHIGYKSFVRSKVGRKNLGFEVISVGA